MEDSITIECLKVILDGLGWKDSEGDMETEDWRAIRPFLDAVKEKHPELCETGIGSRY